MNARLKNASKPPAKSLVRRLSASLLLPVLVLTVVVVPPMLSLDPLHRRISHLSAMLPFDVATTFQLAAAAAPRPAFNLSVLSIYQRYYPVPPRPLLRARFLRLLDAANRAVAAEPVPFHALNVSRAFSVEPKLASRGYVHTDDPVDPLCFPQPWARRFAQRPQVCLSTLSNAVFTTSGIALQPSSATLYELSGGCCDWDWPVYVGKTIKFPRRTFDTVASHSGKAILVLNQHHGSTFHHIIHEIVSRYLLVLPLLDANPEILVATDHSKIAPTILSILGLARHRLIAFSSLDYASMWTFGSLLLYPPPVYMHEHQGHFPRNQTITTARILRHVVERDSPLKAHNATRPILVLMERAVRRRDDGSCRENRCVKNFAMLRRALERRLAGRVDVMLFRAAEELHTAIALFSAASVVVGVHGAGFQNVMFCRPGTTVVHIGWDMHYKGLVEQFSLRFHQVNVPTMRRHHSNIVLDVDMVVDGVTKAIVTDKVVNATAV